MRTLTLKMLLLTVLTQVTFAAVNNPPETSIVEHMERAQSEISVPNHITRDYRLGRPDAKVESYGVAEVDFRPPGRYTVTKRSGSHSCDAAVKYILQHEIEIAMSIKKSAAVAVTRENYVFTSLGDTVLDGRSYYLLHLEPKRRVPELIVGSAWIDKQSFLIRRVEGNIAKSPSWLVKSVHVRFDFVHVRQMWVQSSLEAVADIRWLGAQKLTSHVLGYEAASVVAAKIGDEAHALAAGPSPPLTVALPGIEQKHE